MNISNKFRTPFIVKKCKHLNKRNEEKNTIIRTEKKYYLARVSRKYENKEIKTTTKRLVRINSEVSHQIQKTEFS